MIHFTPTVRQAIKTRFLILTLIISTAGFSKAQEINPDEVREAMKKMADWQIDHFNDLYSERQKPHDTFGWANAALYAGMTKWAALSNENKYYNWLKDVGQANNWELHGLKYNAEDQAAGQMYLTLYEKYKDENMLTPTKNQMRFIMYHPAKTSLHWATPFHKDRWNWCDALFMAPPIWTKLYNITGDRQYLDFMVSEFKASTDFLFDKKEHLYYRDERYMDKLDHGTKVFWSRGNGWVFAGLINIMNELDKNSKEYSYFIKIYKKMAKKLVEIQTPEGHWAMSLLGQKFYPTPETSGTSFFIYGLTWGINQGELDKKTYEPVVKKAWNALVEHITIEGYLGYVQPMGGAPGKAWPDKTEVFGTGAFLFAGSEIYKLYGGK